MTEKTPNLAQIVCTYPPYKGGLGNSAFKLAEFLSDKYNIHTFTLTDSTSEVKSINNHNHIHYCSSLFKIGKAGFIKNLFAQLRSYSTIVFHYSFFGADLQLALFLWLHPKRKLILYYHMDPQLQGAKKILSLPSRLIKSFLLKRSHTIVVSSLDYIKHHSLKSFYYKHSDKFQEIPFSVDTTKFSPKPTTNSTPKLLFVGGLDKAHYFKGLPVLFQALKSIENLSWHLDIVGEGELQEYYKQEISKLGLDHKVSFSGKTNQDKLISYYQQADIFILPSINKSEAFGIVLLEAMSCQTPVIASDLYGVRQVFEDKKQGLLATKQDPQDLAEKIKYLLNNPKIRDNMGKQARDLVESKYSQEQIKTQILNTI